MTTTYINVPEETFKRMEAQLETISKKIEKIEKKKYLNHEELMAFFNLSDRTIRRWRDEGKLGYSQPSDHCYIYKVEDVEALLAATYRKPFALKRVV